MHTNECIITCFNYKSYQGFGFLEILLFLTTYSNNLIFKET
jgi:hypothetical protein